MRIEKLPDGRNHYIADEGETVFMPGPVRGEITLSDGTVVDVTPEAIVLPMEQHAEAAQLVADRYETEGHPDHLYGDAFVHDTDQSAANLTQEG